MIHSSARRRLLCVAAGTTSLLAMAPAAFAAPSNAPGWSATTQDITTGVILGYELGIDTLNDRLYAADAQAGRYERRFVPNADGTFSNAFFDTTVQAPTGKVVALDLNTHAFVRNYNFTGLPGSNSDGTLQAGPAAPTFATTPGTSTTGLLSANTTQTANMPYGVAIDTATQNANGDTDPTIVTVQTRTSTVAIFPASKATPAASDLLLPAQTGLVRARTPVVDTTRHKAYVVGYNANTGVVVQINTITKAVEATYAVPGAVGLALDPSSGLLYAGTFNAPGGTNVTVIDPSLRVTTADPKDATAQTAAIVTKITGVGINARPGFDSVGKKLYTANVQDKTVSVVDLNPANTATYRTVIKTIQTPGAGSPNAVAVDGARGLVYVTDLGSKTLSVIDAATNEYVQGVPTTGNALDVDVDPRTGIAYVSSMNSGTTTGVGQVQAIRVSKPSEQPKDGAPGTNGTNGTNGADGAKGDPGTPGAQGPAGTPGAQGAPGPVGAAGPAGPAGTPGAQGAPGAQGPAGSGIGELSIALESLRLVGTKVRVQAPAAGEFSATVTAGGRTIAKGSGDAEKAGTVSFALTKTAYGRSKLRAKTLRGTLTVKFTPAADKATRSQKSVKATLKRTRR